MWMYFPHLKSEHSSLPIPTGRHFRNCLSAVNSSVAVISSSISTRKVNCRSCCRERQHHKSGTSLPTILLSVPGGILIHSNPDTISTAFPIYHCQSLTVQFAL